MYASTQVISDSERCAEIFEIRFKSNRSEHHYG